MEATIQPEITEKIKPLEKKFKNSGQDLGFYLDSLLHGKYLTYWDCIQLDTLLSLQVIRTHFPDKKNFITYHQITELYFKQIVDDTLQTTPFFTKKLTRINRYFGVLIDSFEVMIKGIKKEQSLKFRMSLLPASGFQSVQFRLIEIYATALQNLVNADRRDQFRSDTALEDLDENLYWKSGATDLETEEKTLALKQFEYRYPPRMIRIANQVKNNTVYQKYQQLPEKERNNALLIDALRTFDTNVNINWLLRHRRAAYRYLNKGKEEISATGGTNWKSFLPPSFQRIPFFPNLWNQEEKENWGQQWVTHQFNNKKTALIN